MCERNNNPTKEQNSKNGKCVKETTTRPKSKSAKTGNV